MKIIHGDCLEELKRLEDNSVDAVITDPPYGLSNTKPAQVADVLKAWVTGDTVSVPAKRGGFMGADWDSFVPPPAVWGECMRVLKPGGHMAVFAGARTQDLMGLSIRLAGFEIRDTLGWIYGSGFPKSMDIGKAIDKGQGLSKSRALEFTEWMRSTGITATQINEATETNMGSHYLTDASQPAIATADLFDKLRPLLPEVPERIERLVAERTGIEWADYVKREVMSERPAYGIGGNGILNGHSEGAIAKVTAPATSEAKQWDGWGTALKPAIEPIILARKPLDGTVANNVLAHGVGGLNIDACRVGTTGARNNGRKKDSDIYGDFGACERVEYNKGRFPANVLLDEHAATEMDKQSGWLKSGERKPTPNTAKSQGVCYGSFAVDNPNYHPPSEGGASRFFPVFKSEEGAPETKGRFPVNVLLDEHAAEEMDKQSGWSKSPETTGRGAGGQNGRYHPIGAQGTVSAPGDSGGASRFFPVFKYQAKAPKRERPVIVREDGTKVQHPTVKPLKLMEWLVTLITPEGGTILDPFAGTGTTLQAATNKGFHPIGIEADTDYIQLIHKRLEGGTTSTRSS